MKTKFTIILSIAFFIAILPLSAKTYLYTGGTNPWTGKSDGTITQVNATNVSVTLNAIAASEEVWMAAGNYPTTAAIVLHSGILLYGGFVGTESAITDRTCSDLDGNGVIEPWEFTNATIIQGVGKTGTSVAYALLNSSAALYTLDGVTFDGHNTSNSTGGAIYTNANSLISNCIIRNINHTGASGGAGIYSNANGGATITGCLIENCVTSASGGAIYANRKVSVKQCVIRNNYASTVSTSKGGAIYLESNSDTNTSYIINNAIYNNTAAFQGGAITLADADGTGPVNIINNTIVNNCAVGTSASTGGIIGLRITSQKYYNNVFYNNYEGAASPTTVKNFRTTLTTGNIDLQYSAYNAGSQTGNATFSATGNIAALSAPNFVQPSTTKGYTATMPNDVKVANFTILSNSALRDVGMTSSDIPAIDLINNVRPNGTLNDIGAFEWSSVSSPVLSYPTNGSTLSQNFDILTTLGLKTLYTNSTGSAITTALGPWNLSESTIYNKSELTGWQLYKTGGSTASAGTVQIGYGAGGNGTVNFYYLGNSNTAGADQSLGGNFGSALSGAFGVVLQNNTGNDLTSFSLTYTGEQWKNVSSPINLAFKYAIGSSSSIKDISTGTFTPVSQLNFVSPNTTNSGTIDGNAAAYRTTKVYTVSGISWTNGSRLVLRWDCSSGELSIDDVSFTTSVPTISASTNSLTGFSTTYGSGSSTEQSFTVGGTNMLGSITVTPPADYEISTTSGSGFGSTPITVGSSGTISATTIYARLKSGLSAGSYNNENIVVSSTGGVTVQNVRCSGTVSPLALTVSPAVALDKVFDSTNAAIITGSLSGVINSDDVTLSGIGTFSDSSVGNSKTVTSTSTLGGTNAGNYSLTQPTGLTANIYPVISTFSKNGSSNWSGATEWTYIPMAATDLVISSGELVIDQNPTVNSITVAPGAKLTLGSGKTLTAGTFTIQSDATGTGTFVDNGGTLSATMNVQRYLKGGRNWYISSPVSSATANVFNVGSSKNALYYYQEAKGSSANPWYQITKTDTLLSVMQGYVTKLNADTTIAFTGTINTGDKTISFNRTTGQTKEGFNLVGNPYPSYVSVKDADTLHIESSYWLRSRNAGNSAYVFDTYNLKSGMGIANSGLKLTKYIPPMQAFWIRVKQGFNSGSLTFHNSLRAHQDSVNNVFRAPEAIVSNQQTFRLQVSNGINSDETMLYTNFNASNGFDDYDSQKMMDGSTCIPEIYTFAGTEQLAINGLNSILYNTEIPLGFTTLTSGNFSLKAAQISNFEAGTQIILKDYLDTNNPVITDLSDGSSYTFASAITSNNSSRFTLTFKAPSIATGINPNSKDNVWISTNANGQIQINGISTGEALITVYNSVGQKLLSKKFTKTDKQIETLPAGIYMVTVIFAGNKLTEKLIVN